MTFEGEQQGELLALFQPVYLQLVDTFIQKSLLPPDAALTSEEREMFRCYRQDICDTYVSSCGMIMNIGITLLFILEDIVIMCFH